MARHSGTTHLIDLFEYTHLPAHLLIVSKPFADLAIHAAKLLQDGPELTSCLRKLLEAKDCAVRQAVIDARKASVTSQLSGPPLSAKLGDSPDSDVKPQESAEKPQVAPTGTVLDGLIKVVPGVTPWKVVIGEDGERYWEVVPPIATPVAIEPVEEPQVEPLQCRCPKSLGGKHVTAGHARGIYDATQQLRGVYTQNEIRAHEGLPSREYNWKEQRC